MVCFAIFEPAKAGESESLEPEHSLPVFPRPSVVLMQDESREFGLRILQQTAAGTAANSARESNAPGPYVWIQQQHHPDYSNWLESWRARTGVPCRKLDGNAWSLVQELKNQEILKGYVLYRADKSGRTPYCEGESYQDSSPNGDCNHEISVNIATSLCGPLRSVAVEEALQAEAEAHGLKLLEDCRGKDYSWLIENYGGKFSRDILSSLDPLSSIARDLAIACNALVVFNVPNGGFAEALQRTRPGGAVIGWGMVPENGFVGPISKRGLEIVASNWSYNLPLLVSEPAKMLKCQPISPIQDDSPQQRYVAFVESDGDNITWLMGDFSSDKRFYAHPERGSMPFSWSIASSSLGRFGTDAWNSILRSSTPADDFVQCCQTGYAFIDEAPPEALKLQASRMDGYLQKTGITTAALWTHNKWDAPEAVRAYESVANNCPSLRGILAVQYAPYAAGRGAQLWCRRGKEKVPVISAKAAIWKMKKGTPEQGSPAEVAQILNEWAKRPAGTSQDRFAWVIVHAWSNFSESVTGFGAAKECAKQLDPSIRVIKASELVELVYRSANQ